MSRSAPSVRRAEPATPSALADHFASPPALREELLAFKSSKQHETQDFFLNNGGKDGIAVDPNFSITNYQARPNLAQSGMRSIN